MPIDIDLTPCPGCGSHLSDRERKVKDSDPEDELSTKLLQCEFCGKLKCVMCDLGDDVHCLQCNQDDVDDDEDGA